MATRIENDTEVVDVDTSDPANVNLDSACDSGVETLDSTSVVFPTMSDSESSPVMHKICDINRDKLIASNHHENDCEKPGDVEDTDSSVSSSLSISPELNGASIPLHLRDYDDLLIDVSNDSSDPDSNKVEEYSKSLCEQAKDQYNFKESNEVAVDVTLNFNKSMTHSTTSLNILPATHNDPLAKNALSKSVEHISTINLKIPEKLEAKTNIMINTEEILSKFHNQKHKVSATQKINPVTDHTHLISEIKYPRLPKEILSQDLGSIVKNVHGIFSSVSGSLKNAYNQSQKGTLQKSPVKHIDPPITYSKLMDEIFEEKIDDADPPVKVTFVPEITNCREAENVNKLVNINNIDKLEADPKTDVLRMQIQSLERVLSDKRKENAALKERMQKQNDKITEKEHLYKELETKMDLMKTRVEQAEREKDAAVMRYASVECAGIESKTRAERAEQRERSARIELDLLSNKLKSAHSEKQRIIQLYDDKCHEVATSERELSRVKEELRELEGRLKWTQSKLRLEIDANKEGARSTAQTDAAVDTARRTQLESELKESQATLILCRHEKEELARQLASLSAKLDACSRERDENSAALHTAREQVAALEAAVARLEAEAAELAGLRAKAALADTLQAQLQCETERRSAAEQALGRERARADTCAWREAGALEHAAALTAEHVASQARADTAQTKALALSCDNAALRERLSALEEECGRLRTELADETERRVSESKQLARKVAELTEELAQATTRLEWERGELRVLKTRHQHNTKELHRELARALRRCEQLEARALEVRSERTGSVSSMSSGEVGPGAGERGVETLTNGDAPALPDVQIKHPSLMHRVVEKSERQRLVERVVSLQQALARRAERADFLEEHCATLTSELRNKTKLLRALLPSLPAGALATAQRDFNKKELASLGGGGVMAALWGGGGGEGELTLELSLEMNRRLQAVLEDALLKNITLKENMDTLGEEIARLKGQKNSKLDDK